MCGLDSTEKVALLRQHSQNVTSECDIYWEWNVVYFNIFGLDDKAGVILGFVK